MKWTWNLKDELTFIRKKDEADVQGETDSHGHDMNDMDDWNYSNLCLPILLAWEWMIWCPILNPHR